MCVCVCVCVCACVCARVDGEGGTGGSFFILLIRTGVHWIMTQREGYIRLNIKLPTPAFPP